MLDSGAWAIRGREKIRMCQSLTMDEAVSRERLDIMGGAMVALAARARRFGDRPGGAAGF